MSTVGQLTRRYSDATVLMHATIAKKAGLSGADHKYLGLLMQHGPMTAGKWASLTGLTTGAITGLIDRLEKKMLVKRTADQTDRRKQVIVPNMAQAEQLLGSVFADLQSKTAQFIATMTDAEVAAVERYLRANAEIMERVTQELQQQ
ncbi:MarR family transcriptional regulator [Hymenobacter sp. M29]|uniref:MarR family transcriptional regulator n=1 Tax=Hymenobacter mellowenesis TaxID=3063995 RepID=A0ABT9AI26_9BACT|nr:MarR family transcriptional regulator [Hymenobacter sp. M29]MDO7849521.1 MarR family transcriptional regulator [Hymenobacter sp. M29]